MLDPLPPITPNSSSSIKNNLTHSSSLPEREVNFDDEPNYSPLKLGDRVVWLSDNGPEFGTVRWLGVLPGASSHTMAGVEFDNPVGTGTGLYNRQQLFLTRKKHASFIPLLGLIKADDFVAANSPEHKVHHPVPKAAPRTEDLIVLLADEVYKTRLGDDETCGTGKPVAGPSPDLPEPYEDRFNGYGDVGVGSMVEVTVNEVPHYGVVRWAGHLHQDHQHRLVAGIEMEEDIIGGTDGTFNGRRYFKCAPKRGFFVSMAQCRLDRRFQEQAASLPNGIPSHSGNAENGISQPECPIIRDYVRPLKTEQDVTAMCGKFRGIQGHHNSCYLDATLFGMFAFTTVFDSLLFRPPTPEDGPHYLEVQRVLREEIVNPLRSCKFVRADRVMHLRQLLEKIGSVTGMTSEEKDPEELLTSLVTQTLRAKPYLKLSSGQEAFMHQLFVEKDEEIDVPSVQQLFEQSFLSSDIKLKQVPPVLILQMPRFGKAYKMYPRILPSQILDVTDVIENCPRQCIICGKLAYFECRECFGECGSGLESITFCQACLETVHNHQRRQSHAWKRLSVPKEYLDVAERYRRRNLADSREALPPIPRIYMELFAVVCIETSHYVAFIKGGTGPDAPWLFFDSMADRRGEQNGYNIPEVSLCPDLPKWLQSEGLPLVRDERQLPERAKRLLCDAYMCFYQSPQVAMYN
ncbi:Hypothetical predicted protein [Cloeon dipterum]|uniref:ubiquitinyl hydrolase 1 n=1 Tax=Cloeon dipterum TaxID=197152 RepID=A0A8S1CRQ6_9INSE|nr:Hypothetical predicted protein [Cloeon dipterum]